MIHFDMRTIELKAKNPILLPDKYPDRFRTPIAEFTVDDKGRVWVDVLFDKWCIGVVALDAEGIGYCFYPDEKRLKAMRHEADRLGCRAAVETDLDRYTDYVANFSPEIGEYWWSYCSDETRARLLVISGSRRDACRVTCDFELDRSQNKATLKYQTISRDGFNEDNPHTVTSHLLGLARDLSVSIMMTVENIQFNSDGLLTKQLF